MKKGIRSISIVGLLLTILLFTSTTNAQMYEVIDLGLGRARAINDRGQIVVYSHSGESFLYDNGTITNLGLTGYVSDINNSCQIVGYYSPNWGENHAFLYDNGIMTDLGTFGGSASFASAINDSGQIVGFYNTNSGNTSHAFLYDNSTFTDLGTWGRDSSSAVDINDNGLIVGITRDWNSEYREYGYSTFLYETGIMTDIGGYYLFPAAINNSGQIVGERHNEFSGSRGYFIDNGALTYVYSVATFVDINDSGQMIGIRPGPGDQAVLYNNGAEIYLHELLGSDYYNYGIGRSVASAINNNGEIVGYAYNYNTGSDHAILWRPTVVPEPISSILFITGGVLLAGRRYFKRKTA